jgi:carboxypeptidase Taq
MTRFDSLVESARETALLDSISELLQWDERTCLPSQAGDYRAEQIAYLSGVLHRRRTDPRVGEWLESLTDELAGENPHGDRATTVRQLKREYDKRVKVPDTLVEELTRTAVLGQQAWVQARQGRNFATLQPYLEKIVRLKRDEAQAVGFRDCIYDALLDDFEPGVTTAAVSRVFTELREGLIPLVQATEAASRRPPTDILRRSYPIPAQERFATEAATAIGFDFQRGRLDTTQHPFCSELGPNDCRITTRYDEHYFPTAFFGTLHEAGHGIYEQGLRSEQYGLPPGQFVSMGFHESQSRMWENLVGRSHAFWRHFLPRAAQHFPAALRDVTRDQFYFAVNSVRPSLIRVEADEVTYNLHIIVRFELEQELMAGQLAVADLPAAWDSRYQQYLGITPPHDGDGVLQDIHWPAALLGYFPTYSLGNLYAAQLFDQARAELADLPQQIARGDFQPLRDWLRKNVYQHGQCYSPAELLARITGRSLGCEALLAYLRQKLEPLYGI